MRTFLIPALVVLSSAPAWAVEFRAEVDREEVALDESVSLKTVVQADGDVPMEKPSFQAPNFDVINEYQSQFVESYFDNGKVGARFQRSFTFVLRPKTTGKFTISDIQVSVGGQKLQAAPITIQVAGGGQGTPPPRNYGGGGAGLRGSGKAARGTPVFVRADVDKSKAYKGEQVIVSYYLYSRAQQFNAQADKFPALPGFLKEELEMPIVQGRMQDDVVALDGQVYKRVLLARFAAYPLKEGKLTVDPFGVKVTYYDAQRPRPGDDLDAEDLFQQFFNQMAPQTASVKSEPVAIEVQALPQPAPEHFTGAVGDFSVISAVDRYDLRAHEALSLTLKVEGEGNLSTIDVPKITLPSGIEVFESRAQTRTGRGGVGVRVFEYVLIPRQAGDHTIPAIELSFFDPKAKTYVKKLTDPIAIHVAAGDPSMAGQAPNPPSAATANREIPVPEKAIPRVYDLKDRVSEKVQEWGGRGGAFREMALGLLLLGILGVLLKLLWPWLGPQVKKWRGVDPGLAKDREWERLKQSVETPNGAVRTFKEILAAYERVAGRVYDAIDAQYHVGARALSRSELRDILVAENKMPEDQWNRIASLLEFTETVRFASQAGAVSEERVRSELAKWVSEASRLDDLIRAPRAIEAEPAME